MTEIVRREKPVGVIVQFGGQTPLRIAEQLSKLGVPIVGTSVESIDCAEDRRLFSDLVSKLELRQTESGTASSLAEAQNTASRIGFPLMIRPSFVLGGRAMRVVYSEEDLRSYMNAGVEVSRDRPVLLDRFLDNAIEVDVDAVSDGTDVLIAGVMEHVEPAGIHSGDSSCCLPPQSLSFEIINELKRQAKLLARGLNVVGLLNVQFAVTTTGLVYVLEANPRASRTVPFVSKATGVQWAKVAARVMAGKKLKELKISEKEPVGYYAVKASVFPFSKFPGVDTLLGPEMKSTGEVMGLHTDFAGAFAKSQIAAGVVLPLKGRVFLSVKDSDKAAVCKVANDLIELGFSLVATSGTASYLKNAGIKTETVNKVSEGGAHVVDLIGTGSVSLVINTPDGWGPMLDSRSIRLVANELKIPTYTTLAQARAAVEAISMIQSGKHLKVSPLQSYYSC